MNVNEYLRIPLKSLNDLIISQGGLIDEKVNNIINDLKKDTIDFECLNFDYEIDRANSKVEIDVILENKANFIAEIEKEFEKFIGKFKLDLIA